MLVSPCFETFLPLSNVTRGLLCGLTHWVVVILWFLPSCESCSDHLVCPRQATHRRPLSSTQVDPTSSRGFRCYRSKCYPWLVLWYICCCCSVLNPIHRIWRSMVSVSFDNSKGIKWLIQKKTWISHWMDIAADHWKDQDQIRFHLRRKTRPWSSSIRPTHLILDTDNLLNLSLDFLTAPWSRCVWFWIRITGILLLQSTSTSAFIKPELWLNTCGLEPINYQNTCAWLLFCCWDLLDNFHTFLSRGDIIYPECPQPIHRPIILPR